MITESLDYEDAWALKRTSRHFARVIEIPTLRFFLGHLGRISKIKKPKRLKLAKAQWAVLETLIRAGYFPEDEATCRFCCCIASFHYFDRNQQNVREDEQDIKAIADMFCIECGAENDMYSAGDCIPCDSDFGADQLDLDVGLASELTLCFSCLRIIRYEGFSHGEDEWIGPCRFCRACEPCMRRSNAILNSGLVQSDSTQPCQHVETLSSIPDRTRQQGAVPGFSKFPQELLWHFYEYLDRPTLWNLAQTCDFFNSSMHVTTVKRYHERRSFSSLVQSEDLAALHDWNMIPLDGQPCIYCRRFWVPQSSRLYYWKLLAYVDASSSPQEESHLFRRCCDCESNHGSTNGCTYLQDIYTPCPDCMCCAECMDLADQVLKLKRVPEECRRKSQGTRPGGTEKSCNYCERALCIEESMERLRRVGCEKHKSSYMENAPRNVSSEDAEKITKYFAERKLKSVENLEKEALRSGQKPEPSKRACYHPEVFHILFNIRLKLGEHVLGLA